MDFKTNFYNIYKPMSNSKGSPLVQPLINISKASTPVRTRVVTGTQPNSTPINIHKIGGFDNRSPGLNK
jgi:hypothetical protein